MSSSEKPNNSTGISLGQERFDKSRAQEAEAAVRAILAMQFGINEADPKPTDKLVDDLGADSLDEVEILMALECELQIGIPDEADYRHFTVQELIDYCAARPKVEL